MENDPTYKFEDVNNSFVAALNNFVATTNNFVTEKKMH